MNHTDITDRNLIDFVYTELAGQKIRDNISDFVDYKKWIKVVGSMDKKVAITYRICILDNQVRNGGLIQYFDNRYGIFAYETLNDLKTIGAKNIYEILNKSLEIINPNNYLDERFIKYIFNLEYNNNWEIIADKFRELDNEYDSLEEKENLEILLSVFLRQNLE